MKQYQGTKNLIRGVTPALNVPEDEDVRCNLGKAQEEVVLISCPTLKMIFL